MSVALMVDSKKNRDFQRSEAAARLSPIVQKERAVANA